MVEKELRVDEIKFIKFVAESLKIEMARAINNWIKDLEKTKHYKK